MKNKIIVLLLTLSILSMPVIQALTGEGFGFVYAQDSDENLSVDDFAAQEDLDDISAFANDPQVFSAEVVRLVNVERAKKGKPPLADWYPELGSAAQVRAKEITSVFSHTRPNGKSCFTALDEKGVV